MSDDAKAFKQVLVGDDCCGGLRIGIQNKLNAISN